MCFGLSISFSKLLFTRTAFLKCKNNKECLTFQLILLKEDTVCCIHLFYRAFLKNPITQQLSLHIWTSQKQRKITYINIYFLTQKMNMKWYICFSFRRISLQETFLVFVFTKVEIYCSYIEAYILWILDFAFSQLVIVVLVVECSELASAGFILGVIYFLWLCTNLHK